MTERNDAKSEAGPGTGAERVPGLRHAERLRVEPGPPLVGEFRPPGSKSIAQRVLACAALTSGSTSIGGLPDADDVRAALGFVEAFGAAVAPLALGGSGKAGSGPAAVRVTGRPPSPSSRPLDRGPERPIPLGESGTLARLALASLSLCAPAGHPVTLRPEGSLRRRSSPALVRALREAGVEIEGEGFALTLRPVGPPSSLRLERPGSSQEVTALLLALAAYPGEFELVVEGGTPSRPYLDITRSVLKRFGVEVESTRTGAGEEERERFRVRGPLARPEPAASLVVEADASAAAVGLAAGCITGGALAATGLGCDSSQGDVRMLEHLAAFGCATEAGVERLFASGVPRGRVELDLSGEPDLAPVLAAVAARAAEDGGGARLVGLETLPGKESSRIEVLARGLRAFGYDVEDGPAHLAIGPRIVPAPGTVPELDPKNDHRMAFAFALLGLFAGPVTILRPACVSKSWPSFFDALAGLGARVRPVD